jgi:GPH family glycoside/pentoside/hexuronide:cation symporter
MQPTLARWQKWIYGFGDTSFSLTSTIIGAYFAIFLTDVVGLAPKIAAVAIFIGRTWDYINDPLFGHLTDRVRTRWGRRRPFLLFGALPFAIVFTMMWWKPPLEDPVTLVIYYAVMYVIYDACFTLVAMPYFALTPELAPDYDERTELTSIRMLFSILGSLVSFTIPLLMIGSFSPENAGHVLGMGAAFGLASALPLLLVFIGTRERSDTQRQPIPSLSKSVRAAWGNRPFIFGLMIFLFTWVGLDLMQTTLLYFIKYVVQRESQSDLIMAAVFVTAMLALPLWNWASRRLNKRWAYVIGIAFWAVVQLVLVTFTPNTPFALLLGLSAMAGIGVSAAHVLPWSILPDAIEWGELASGERHEGMFYSLVTLAQKVASSAAIPLALLILDSTGYQANSAIQPASAVAGIRWITGPIPAVLLLMGIGFALTYPLERKSFQKIRSELSARQNPPPS